jgi:nucleoside-diphosphate-sugar epimerase
MQTVLVTGGAGYVGSLLVPEMLDAGYRVKVLDLMIYGDESLDPVAGQENLEIIRGDIRDQDLLREVLPGCDTVIHLASISNDPSFELNPELGKSINFDSFEPLVQIARDSGVGRFIFASSASVYGIKEVENVDEDQTLEPLTDYSKYKMLGEQILARYQSPEFTTVVVRPATICGWSPRQRLDVIVNILTNHAVNNRKIRIFGGSQKRPNVHVRDIVDLYMVLLELPDEQVAGKIWNAGYENHTANQLAEIVKSQVGEDVEMEIVPTDDQRSYHISSKRIFNEIGWRPTRPIDQAVHELAEAMGAGRLEDPMNNPMYFNIKRMQEIDLR